MWNETRRAYTGEGRALGSKDLVIGRDVSERSQRIAARAYDAARIKRLAGNWRTVAAIGSPKKTVCAMRLLTIDTAVLGGCAAWPIGTTR
jgi:hypothetical protein